MTDFFPVCLARTVDIERGFVDNPADRGGPTKFGITQATLGCWRGRPVTAADVAALELPEATSIYRAWFWNALLCGTIAKPQTAAILFDASVLFGVRPAAVCAQRALRASGIFPALSVDGHVGPATRDALNAVDPRVFAPAFARELTLRIDVICSARPVDQEFREGWLKRVGGYAKLNINFGKDSDNVS